MRDFFHKFLKACLDGLFPAFCLGCKAEGSFLCDKCQKTIEPLEVQTCPWCYEPDTLGKVCDKCFHGNFRSGNSHLPSERRFIDGLLAFCRYKEHSLLQRTVHQLKYDFIEDLAIPLGRLLFDTLRPLIESDPARRFTLCPLPLHDRRRRWRGFNQAERLCATIVREAHKAGYGSVDMVEFLERTHFSKPQMELHREERFGNVAGSFRLRSGFELLSDCTRTVVIVDDIATTLSTMNAAAEPLKKAGAVQVYGLVLARVFECAIMTSSIESL